MGKILTTLRQNGPVELRPSTFHGGSGAAPGELDLLGGDVVPYIEIGPRRLVEASPGVLKDRPATPPSTPASVLPRPHSVRFRNLPPIAVAKLATELVAYHAPGEPA